MMHTIDEDLSLLRVVLDDWLADNPDSPSRVAIHTRMLEVIQEIEKEGPDMIYGSMLTPESCRPFAHSSRSSLSRMIDVFHEEVVAVFDLRYILD